MRISDWSSDVCSSDLIGVNGLIDMRGTAAMLGRRRYQADQIDFIGIEEGMDHGLDIIGIRTADIGRNKYAWLSHKKKSFPTLPTCRQRRRQIGRAHV